MVVEGLKSIALPYFLLFWEWYWISASSLSIALFDKHASMTHLRLRLSKCCIPEEATANRF